VWRWSRSHSMRYWHHASSSALTKKSSFNRSHSELSPEVMAPDTGEDVEDVSEAKGDSVGEREGDIEM
jgi:hypothetical protein